MKEFVLLSWKSYYKDCEGKNPLITIFPFLCVKGLCTLIQITFLLTYLCPL